jgi:hypothetical protein
MQVLSNKAALDRFPDGKPETHTASWSASLSSMAESLYLRTRRAEDQLGDIAGAAFRAADELQRKAFGVLTDAWDVRRNWQLMTDVSGQLGLAASLLESQEERNAAQQQVGNTVKVFNLVKNVRNLIPEPATGDLPLRSLVQSIRETFRDYTALWAIEGLGHDYADRAWASGRDPRDLMTAGQGLEAPTGSLTMLHAGLGLCFGERLLKTVTPYSRESAVLDVVRHFTDLCNANCRQGYAGCAFESLGLVTRTWHPQMVTYVDRILQGASEDLLGYFWHGAGRALYFLPTHLVPDLYSPWQAAEREPRHETGRMSAHAGVAWGTSLVNLPNPEVLARVVRRRTEDNPRNPAFTHGIAASLAMSNDTTPLDPVITRFLEYRPQGCKDLQKLWERLVRRPCEEAVQHAQARLRSEGRLEELFRFQRLEGVV